MIVSRHKGSDRMDRKVIIYTLATDKDFGVMECSFPTDFTPDVLVTLLKRFNVQSAVIISGNKESAQDMANGLCSIGFVHNRASNDISGIIDETKRKIFMVFPNIHASAEEIVKFSLFPAMSGRVVQLVIFHEFPFGIETDEYIRTRLRLN